MPANNILNYNPKADMLLSIGNALLQSAAPSRMPRGILSGVPAALMGAQQRAFAHQLGGLQRRRLEQQLKAGEDAMRRANAATAHATMLGDAISQRDAGLEHPNILGLAARVSPTAAATRALTPFVKKPISWQEGRDKVYGYVDEQGERVETSRGPMDAPTTLSDAQNRHNEQVEMGRRVLRQHFRDNPDINPLKFDFDTRRDDFLRWSYGQARQRKYGPDAEYESIWKLLAPQAFGPSDEEYLDAALRQLSEGSSMAEIHTELRELLGLERAQKIINQLLERSSAGGAGGGF